MHWVKIPLFNWVKVKKDVIDIESRTWREVRERSGETKNCFMQLNIECFNGTEKHHRHNANRWSWILKIAVVPFLCFLPQFFFLFWNGSSLVESCQKHLLLCDLSQFRLYILLFSSFSLSEYQIERQQCHCVLEVHLILVYFLFTVNKGNIPFRWNDLRLLVFFILLKLRFFELFRKFGITYTCPISLYDNHKRREKERPTKTIIHKKITF